MSKIVITEKGKTLQRELFKEQLLLNFLPQNTYLDTNTIDQSQSRSASKIINLSTNQEDQFKSEQIKHKLPTTLNEDNTINNANNYGYSMSFNPKNKNLSDPSLNNTYVKKRIMDLSRDLRKELSEKHLKYKSLHIPSQNNTRRQDISFLHVSSVSPPSSSLINNLQNSYEYDEIINKTNDTVKDQFMVRNHYQLLHIESSIEKMLDRYKLSRRKIEDVEKKIQLKYENIKRDVTEKNHKPPEFLEDIKQNNPDAMEILTRKTNSPFRHKKRLGQIIKKEYQPYWDYFGERATKQFISSSLPKNK